MDDSGKGKAPLEFNIPILPVTAFPESVCVLPCLVCYNNHVFPAVSCLL